MTPQPVTLLNTGFPVALLGGAALALPRLLLPRESRSHRVLLAALGASAGLLIVLGMAVFAVAQVLGGADLAGALKTRPGATLLSLARSSALGALVWAPLLALAWLTLAGKIEARRGADMRKRP